MRTMLDFSFSDNSAELADEEILARSKAEPWLFAVLLDRYQDAFLRKAKSIIFDPLDAEEVVQDAFTKIYVHAEKFEVREGAKFSSWAYTILINTALTRYQKKVKEGQRMAPLDPEYEQMVGDMSEHSAFEKDRDAVERILERMPKHLSYVLRLHFLERWSHKDIANETGESVGTIKARVHRAKEAFRKESKDEQAEMSL